MSKEDIKEAVEEYILDDDILNLNDRDKVYKTGLKLEREKGRKESKIEIAKNLLKNNMDISLISKYTDLSIEEIKKL